MFLIFKKPEYRRFNLKPRYWDPAKEEREERERRVKAELGLKDDDKTYIPNIKGQFRQEYEKRKANRNGLNSNYALRLFMILTLLFIMAFYIRGLMAIISEWLKNDCADSIMYVTGVIQQCVKMPQSETTNAV